MPKKICFIRATVGDRATLLATTPLALTMLSAPLLLTLIGLHSYSPSC